MVTALVWPAALLLATAMLSIAALRAWRGWLDLKRLELSSAQGIDEPRRDPSPAARIEMADLKERLRKLEAIATGVDL